jgi:hypothetical protein
MAFGIRLQEALELEEGYLLEQSTKSNRIWYQHTAKVGERRTRVADPLYHLLHDMIVHTYDDQYLAWSTHVISSCQHDLHLQASHG